MAVHELTSQFETAQSRINLGKRAAVAQAAHLEVRAVLRAAQPLTAQGLHDVLIGSYARDTGIWPGKDVDIFGKLTAETINSITPEAAYQLFLEPLRARYGERLTEQPRSIKIDFGPGRGPGTEFLAATQVSADDVFDFAVDVVPAVRWGDRWGIPKRDRDLWLRESTAERWVRTDPETLTTQTEERNDDIVIGTQGAFVPTVKAIKQTRRHHLGDARPGGLYCEFILHEGFRTSGIAGESWADVTASALRYLAQRLDRAGGDPVIDPVLDTPYTPAPDPAHLAAAASTFEYLAGQAEEALRADRCPAAAAWRTVFGVNGNGGADAVFPLPPGCRADGTAISVAAVNRLEGSDEARGFGDA